MKTIAAVIPLFLAACGPMEMMPSDAPPAVDESKCTKFALEADGRDTPRIEPLPAGQYVVSTTYLRLHHTKSTQALLTELTTPMESDLRANGVVRQTTRLSAACNTARTLTVWKSEADMYRFVASPSHAKAMGRVSELSRGNSITTHWSADERGATWEKATEMLSADDNGPIY